MIKLVYDGPAMSGKATNLMRLHEVLAPDMAGEMMALAGHGVLERFRLILNRLYPALDARYQLQARHAPNRPPAAHGQQKTRQG